MILGYVPIWLYIQPRLPKPYAKHLVPKEISTGKCGIKILKQLKIIYKKKRGMSSIFVHVGTTYCIVKTITVDGTGRQQDNAHTNKNHDRERIPTADTWEMLHT